MLLRLPYVTSPLLVEETRDYHSALIARSFYVDWRDDAAEWQRRVAEIAPTPIEPPIMELLAVGGYSITGRETIGLPRAFSALCWVVGGLLLFALARRLFNDPFGPIAALELYLFLPFAVEESASFMPDPLMVTLMVGSLLALQRHFETPSRRSFAFAAVVSAAAVVVKPPIALFFIIPGALAIAYSSARREAISPRRVGVFLGLVLLPSAAYAFYATVLSTGLEGHVSDKIVPRLLVDPEYWRGWLRTMLPEVFALPLVGKAGAVALAGLALAGVAVARRPVRLLLLSLGFGYVILGLVFTYHIHTHFYYSLPLVPVVALGCAAAVSALARAGGARLAAVAVAIPVALALVAVPVVEQRHGRRADESRQTFRVYEEIGRTTGHTTHAIFLAGSDGLPLQYHGWIRGVAWPSLSDLRWERIHRKRAQSTDERLRSLDPEADFFIAHEQRLRLQPELLQLLEARFTKLAQMPEHAVYRLDSAGPAARSGTGS